MRHGHDHHSQNGSRRPDPHGIDAADARLFLQQVRRPGRSDQSAVAEVEEQMQRANDLIPNLVETTKGFAQHEEGVFREIAEARSKLLAAKSPEETIAAANQQTTALGRLLAVVENYPQLKANEQFNRLMDELSGTENRIAVER